MMIEADKLSNAEYHAGNGVSSSAVKMVSTKSLAHWKAKVYKSSPIFDIGTACHDIVLEGGKNIIRGPETRRGNAWKEAYADASAEGKTLLTEADYDLATEIGHSVLLHPVGNRMAGDSVINEASFFVTDPDTGLKLKARPDSYHEGSGIIYDLKTCQSADPRAFQRDVLTYGYHIQSAFYLHVLELAGYKAERFIFACVEKTAPYAVSVNELSQEYLAYGRMQMHSALAQIADAEKSGVYDTGWSIGVNTIDLPKWLEAPAEFN